METPESSLRLPPAPHRDRRGIALIIVLAFLVLATGLVVAFFSVVTNDRIATKSFASEATSKQLADSAVQLVMAQIRDATTSGSGSNLTGWASQPGMIRTWNTTGASAGYYKLYSSGTMRMTTDTFDPSTDVPAQWSGATGVTKGYNAIYADLNTGAQTTNGDKVYPIIDPRAMGNPIGSGTSPSLAWGFSYGAQTSGGQAIDGAHVISGIADTTGALPMPVQWLYITQNGSIVAPQIVPTDHVLATGSFSALVSATNPIIGRIAFWADDETCKLNINTAAEGDNWQTPSFCNYADLQDSQYQPDANEFNRYPGHPATTSLSPVLWSFFAQSNPQWTNPAAWLSSVPNPGSSPPFQTGSNADANPTLLMNLSSTYWPAMMQISPRNAWGGSKAGTALTLFDANGLSSTALDSDRLYASADELLYSPILSSGTRSFNPQPLSALPQWTPAQMSLLKFFLTANSRAPETNPLNKPKICMWPVKSGIAAGGVITSSSNYSLLDKLIAFCSTSGTSSYYFTRNDPNSNTIDIALDRNQKIYNYFRTMLNQPIPGFNGSFTSGKWNGLQADQIATLIYDYIRSCINLVDASAGTTTAANFLYAYTTRPTVAASGTTGAPGTGQVVPIKITNPDGQITQGMGRFCTLRGGTLQFIARATNQPPLLCGTNGRPLLFDASGTQLSDTNGNFSAALYPKILTAQVYARVNPMHPYTCPQPGLTLNGTSGFVPQLVGPNGPVLAYDQNLLSINPNNSSMLFPIFQLTGTSPFNNSNTPGTFPTRTYPAIDVNNGMAEAVAASGTSKITISGTIYVWTLAINDSSSAPWVAPITHAGLVYLPVQRANSAISLNGGKGLAGAFDIINGNYMDGAKLLPHQTKLEALFIPDPVDVAQGHTGLWANFSLKIANLNQMKADGQALFTKSPITEAIANGAGGGQINNWMAQQLYGLEWQLTAAGRDAITSATASTLQTPFWTGASGPIVGSPAVSGTPGQLFAFTGAHPVQISIIGPGSSNPAIVQQISMDFPDATFPTPKLSPWWDASQFDNYPPTMRLATDSSGNQYSDVVGAPMCTFSKSSGGGKSSRLFTGGKDFRTIYMFVPSEMNCAESGATDPSVPWGMAGLNRNTCDTFRAVEAKYGDTRMIAPLSFVPSSFFAPNPYYFYSGNYTVNAPNVSPQQGGPWPTYMRAAYSMRAVDAITTGATVGTMVPVSGTSVRYTVGGGFGAGTIGGITGIPSASGSGVPNPGNSPAQNLMDVGFSRGIHGYNGTGGHIEYPYTAPTMDFNDSTYFKIWQNGGDFDNGLSMYSDGPFINRADEGVGGQGTSPFIVNPYYSISFTPVGSTMFTPNRQVPSPVILGSLPVGFGAMASSGSPAPSMLLDSWRTFLFNPNPNSPSLTDRNNRAGAAGITEASQIPDTTGTVPIPDYLLLDFFQMPVVQPYPISEPLSTAGKVNMNYIIAPFSYIHRDTAMRGVLKSAVVTAVDDQFSQDYKLRGNADNSAVFSDSTNPTSITGGYNAFGKSTGYNYFRYPVHIDETLYQFDQRFAKGDIFRSPSEICSLWLYPAQQPAADGSVAPTSPQNLLPALGMSGHDDANHTSIKNWWYANPGITRKGLTGTNTRQKPYSYIYPRLTTKSNSYTVHYFVQVLKQTPASAAGAKWVEGTDQVLSQYRGSSLIERYVDPSDPTLPDFTANTSLTLDQFYKFRVVYTKKFSPL